MPVEIFEEGRFIWRNVQPEDLGQLSQLMEQTGWYYRNFDGKFYPSSEYLLETINHLKKCVEEEEGLDGIGSGGFIIYKYEGKLRVDFAHKKLENFLYQ